MDTTAATELTLSVATISAISLWAYLRTRDTLTVLREENRVLRAIVNRTDTPLQPAHEPYQPRPWQARHALGPTGPQALTTPTAFYASPADTAPMRLPIIAEGDR